MWLVGAGCDLRDFDNFVIVSSPIANSLDLGAPQLLGRICLFSLSACRTYFPGGERTVLGIAGELLLVCRSVRDSAVK